MSTLRAAFAAVMLFQYFSAFGQGGGGVEAANEIEIDWRPMQEMSYGMDFERLWYWNLKPEEAVKLAKLAVADCAVSYVRVAIDGAAEFEEGKFDWNSYKSELECMSALKAANPKIKFFASPRPIHEAVRSVYGKKSPEAKNPPYSCYPLWIGVFQNPFAVDGKGRKFLEFRWSKAADYMVRGIRFLRSKGFDIAYVDLKNENDKYYFPSELAKMADSMRKQFGGDCPTIIAPSSFDWGGCLKWLESAEKIKRTDFFDIIGCHNTKNNGDIDALGEAARKLKKPLWCTELHGFDGPDSAAAENTEILWRHIRAGFGGINDWLSLGSEKKEHKMFRNVKGSVEIMCTYYIYKHLVNTSSGGHYLKTVIPASLTSSAAFVKGDTLTVWLLNASDVAAKGIRVSFEGRDAASKIVEFICWGAHNAREGTTGNIFLSEGEASFIADVQPKTLYCFTVKIK